MGIVLQMSSADTGDCGVFHGIPGDGVNQQVPATAVQYNLTSLLAQSDLSPGPTPPNGLQLFIESSDDGLSWVTRLLGPVWKSGPGAVVPSLVWRFPQDANTLAVFRPFAVRGGVVNGIGGLGTVNAPPITLSGSYS